MEGRRAAVLRRDRLRRAVRPARWYIGGLLHHAPAVLAFTNPTTNSYKRLVPGYEAPVNLVYSQRNRSASCRIPLGQRSPKAKRVEFRCPDSTSNPYLAFSAMLLAGLDGIRNRIEPPTPMDKDLYDLPPEELAGVPQVPGSLEEALDALEADNDFLRAGGVFTDDLIETWITYKREHEVDALRLRPHPYEFTLYYDTRAGRRPPGPPRRGGRGQDRRPPPPLPVGVPPGGRFVGRGAPLKRPPPITPPLLPWELPLTRPPLGIEAPLGRCLGRSGRPSWRVHVQRRGELLPESLESQLAVAGLRSGVGAAGADHAAELAEDPLALRCAERRARFGVERQLHAGVGTIAC